MFYIVTGDLFLNKRIPFPFINIHIKYFLIFLSKNIYTNIWFYLLIF